MTKLEEMCVRVNFGKVLGFIVGPKGIDVDLDKIKAIQEMEMPKTEKQWNDHYQIAFDKINEYLSSLLVLYPPKPRKPLILYLTLEDAGIRAMLAQADEAGVENAMYYSSKKLLPNEQKYNLIEKTCSRMDSVKYLYGTPALVGKLGRWLILLSEFDIEYAIKKTVKGRAVVNFLAAHPVEDNEQWEIDFPDEHLNLVEKKGWKLYFDGSAYSIGVGVGILLDLHKEKLSQC
ncbi:uncharacterized protein LOC110008931 [Jatropha curcas]|uniref:uncharacterized protein LOC110008931 n=1 Tax=Jatropha curcas TaxID=180498 RepID=UPI0009D6DE88|nr:uncharacterized protein LOC110008931 [Jatropha curcas]